jgi:hypothetical protein
MLPQNLSAPFITQVPPFKKVLMETLPYVDFLFGNEVRGVAQEGAHPLPSHWPGHSRLCLPWQTEAGTFAETEGWDKSDLEAVALKVWAVAANQQPSAGGGAHAACLPLLRSHACPRQMAAGGAQWSSHRAPNPPLWLSTAASPCTLSLRFAPLVMSACTANNCGLTGSPLLAGAH